MSKNILNLLPAQTVFPRAREELFPITCRACGALADSNAAAILLCEACLSDLGAAAQRVASTYAAAIARFWEIDAAFDAAVLASGEAAWWAKVEAARCNPNVTAASFAAAWNAAQGARAGLVAAWEQRHLEYVQAIAAHDEENKRYRAAAAEFAAARAAGYGEMAA